MSIGTILLIVLVIILAGGVSTGGYGTGQGVNGILGVLLVVLVILFIMGKI